jgi:ParB family chromosome partitioning protein
MKKEKPHVSNNSGNNEWYTPAPYIESARRVMGGIDLDPASCEIANTWINAGKIYTKEDDGLQYEWSGKVWMNPPYGRPLITQFVSKLVQSKDVEQAVVLTNNATETAWAQMLLKESSAVCFPRNRIKFWNESAAPVNTPLQGQMICYIGDWFDLFLLEFSRYGPVYKDSFKQLVRSARWAPKP